MWEYPELLLSAAPPQFELPYSEPFDSLMYSFGSPKIPSEKIFESLSMDGLTFIGGGSHQDKRGRHKVANLWGIIHI